MNGILIPLFQPFVIGSDRSESDCLGRKSALPHSPAIAQFPFSLVKSFLLLYKNYYFLLLWSEALLQVFNPFQSKVKLNFTALFLVPDPGSISNQHIILQSFMSASYKFLS
jgi:hypothetical protein